MAKASLGIIGVQFVLRKLNYNDSQARTVHLYTLASDVHCEAYTCHTFAYYSVATSAASHSTVVRAPCTYGQGKFGSSCGLSFSQKTERPLFVMLSRPFANSACSVVRQVQLL